MPSFLLTLGTIYGGLAMAFGGTPLVLGRRLLAFGLWRRG